MWLENIPVAGMGGEGYLNKLNSVRLTSVIQVQISTLP